MNFDEAFKRCQDGTATPEERDFVKQQIELANQMLADDAKVESAPIKEAGVEEVKKAKKKFKWRYIVIPICCIISSLLIIGAILGGVFGSAASYAKKSANYHKYDCEVAAMYYVDQLLLDGTIPEKAPQSQFEIDDVDLEFNYVGYDITQSYYSYFVKIEYEAKIGSGYKDVKVIIEIDTRNLNKMDVRVKH